MPEMAVQFVTPTDELKYMCSRSVPLGKVNLGNVERRLMGSLTGCSSFSWTRMPFSYYIILGFLWLLIKRIFLSRIVIISLISQVSQVSQSSQ